MKRKRVKGYWLKRKESFNVLEKAKSRANEIRINEYTAHVVVEKDTVDQTSYWVHYSIAKWYFEELEALGIQL